MEFEIDKKLKIKGKEDVMAMGIKAYNGECRSIVTRYVGEWEKTIKRIGRWIDMENDYKTMEPWYMESVCQSAHKKALLLNRTKLFFQPKI